MNSQNKKKCKNELFLLNFQIFQLFEIYYTEAHFFCFGINKLLTT